MKVGGVLARVVVRGLCHVGCDVSLVVWRRGIPHVLLSCLVAIVLLVVLLLVLLRLSRGGGGGGGDGGGGCEVGVWATGLTHPLLWLVYHSLLSLLLLLLLLGHCRLDVLLLLKAV